MINSLEAIVVIYKRDIKAVMKADMGVALLVVQVLMLCYVSKTLLRNYILQSFGLNSNLYEFIFSVIVIVAPFILTVFCMGLLLRGCVLEEKENGIMETILDANVEIWQMAFAKALVLTMVGSVAALIIILTNLVVLIRIFGFDVLSECFKVNQLLSIILVPSAAFGVIYNIVVLLYAFKSKLVLLLILIMSNMGIAFAGVFIFMIFKSTIHFQIYEFLWATIGTCLGVAVAKKMPKYIINEGFKVVLNKT